MLSEESFAQAKLNRNLTLLPNAAYLAARNSKLADRSSPFFTAS